MRSVQGFVLALIAICAALPAASQAPEPEPGCRREVIPGTFGTAADLNFTITETAGLNIVRFNAVGGNATLSDRACLPDSKQGTLEVVLNYGVGTDTRPEDDARESVAMFYRLDHPDSGPAGMPPIMVSAFKVNGMRGAEAVLNEVTTKGAKVFRYKLVFVFPDGAKGFVTAAAPSDQFEALLPKIRSMAAGIRPRRNVQQMLQADADSMKDALASLDTIGERLRGPIVDQALDACLTAPFTSEGTEARATSNGFPAFQLEDQTRFGARWRSSEAPADDTLKVLLGVMNIPSTLRNGRQSLTCIIAVPPSLEPMMRQKFETRFLGKGTQRPFTLVNNRMAPWGSIFDPGPRNGVGKASLETNANLAAIAIEITPVN
jgi:hypothetical protein